MGSAPASGAADDASSSASLCAGADQNSMRATRRFGATARRTAAGAAALPSVLSVCSPFQWIGERARPGRSRRRPRRRHRSAWVRIKTVCAPHEGSARGRAEQRPGRLRSPPFYLFAPRSNGLGSAPASGAADDALVVGIPVRGCGSKQSARHTNVRREVAPNSSRGGCAPLRSICLLPVPMDWGARPPRAQPTTPSSSASQCAGADQKSMRATPRFGARARRTAAGAGGGPLAARHFINLGKFTGAGAAVEFINCFVCEILPSGDVNGFEPTLLPPAPGSRHARRSSGWAIVRIALHPRAGARPANSSGART